MISKLIISEEEYISKLKKLSTTLLWDRSYGNAVVIKDPPRNFSNVEKIAGPVFLVNTPGTILPVLEALHVIPENHVLVINNTVKSVEALLGDIIVESAKLQNLAGIVVFGNIRDVEVIANLDFPVWAFGVSVKAAPLGSPVCAFPQETYLGECLVRKGDWLLADKNGMISIQAEKLRLIIKSAEVKNRKENECIQRIRSGERITSQMNLESFLYADGKLIVEF